MPNATEFSDRESGTYSNDNNYFNGAPRFRCNNVLHSTTTDLTNAQHLINIGDAKNTYEKLYHVYNTQGPGELVTKSILGETDEHCTPTANNGHNCPYNPNNLGIMVGSQPNVLAYTRDSAGNSLLVKDLKFYLDDCGSRIRNYDNNASNTTKSYTDIKTYANTFKDGSYNTLVKTRSDLDNKMNEILGNNKNSILYEKQSELDASVYSTLLWTVMVTSLIYYVFTKI